MSKYRLKKEYRRSITIVKVGDIGYRIDSDFVNRHKNADNLIESKKEIGHFFEDEKGKPVNDEPKPSAKEKPSSSKGKKSDTANK